MDIGHIRTDFTAHSPLRRENLTPCPIVFFERWFNEALQAEIAEPNAFVLATVSATGQPSSRTVLLKYFDEQGFVFYTNYHSQKALEIKANAQVAALFPWLSLQRQVRIEGTAAPIARQQTLRYFLSRPRDSQIGAWCSRQSEVISSRALLLSQWEKMKAKFAAGEVPLPDFWGGYRIAPTRIEFWQGQPSRLHDRFVYQRDQNQWTISRLSP